MDHKLYALSRRVGEALLAKHRKLATAESCTGGWIAKCVTDVPGSSEWFDCSFITYTNKAKQQMLGVPELLLADYGAVSEQVVKVMAAGALERSDATIAVSVSGIAGPDGGSSEKPVGTVWVSWKVKESGAIAERFEFNGERDAIRKQAVEVALKGIISRVNQSPLFK